jgi:hypothetical protein
MVRYSVIGIVSLIAACAPQKHETGSASLGAARPVGRPSQESGSDQAGGIEEATAKWREEERLKEITALRREPRVIPPIKVDLSFEPPVVPSSISTASETFLAINKGGSGDSRSGGAESPQVPVTISTPYYTLAAGADRGADAKVLAGALDVAIAALIVDYAEAGADRLLRAATVRMHIASSPNEQCGPGHATNISSWNEGSCAADIHLLAPSAHPDPASAGAPRTSMNEPMDAGYCQRVLVHEYSTVLLESICRSKGRGWSFWDAPPWFVQGAEEYLGVMYSTPDALNVTFAKYRQETRGRSLVTGDWGIDAKSPYISGPVLVAFIHEHFGRDAFIEVLKSEQPTFGAAMRAVLKCSPEEFYKAFTAWLDRDDPPRSRP